MQNNFLYIQQKKAGKLYSRIKRKNLIWISLTVSLFLTTRGTLLMISLTPFSLLFSFRMEKVVYSVPFLSLFFFFVCVYVLKKGVVIRVSLVVLFCYLIVGLQFRVGFSKTKCVIVAFAPFSLVSIFLSCFILVYLFIYFSLRRYSFFFPKTFHFSFRRLIATCTFSLNVDNSIHFGFPISCTHCSLLLKKRDIFSLETAVASLPFFMMMMIKKVILHFNKSISSGFIFLH